MASPFSIFRKHQKWLMAAVTLLAMFAFVAINPFAGAGGSGRGTTPEETTVATWKFGKITQHEVNDRLAWRQRLNKFISVLQQTAGAPGSRDFFPDNEESVLESILFAKKAELLGMVVDTRAANYFLDYMSGDLLSADQKNKAFVDASNGNYGQDQLFQNLRFELLALNFRVLVERDTIDNGTPYQRWDYFSRVNRRATIQVVPVQVKDFVGKVPDPSDSELRQFFDQYKDKPSASDSPTPGFREPARARFGYFKADLAKFSDAEKSKITDAEIKEYYDLHKDQFRKAAPPEAPPKTTPPAGGTETPKAEPGKADPNKTPAPTKSTDPSKTEPSKTEPPKTESPKAEQPKTPEPAKTSDATKTPESPKTPEPAKTPDVPKPTEPAKTPDAAKTSDKPKTDDKTKADDKPKTDDKSSSDKKSAESQSRLTDELLAFADSPDAPKPDKPKTDAAKPDAPKPDAPKPDAPKADVPKSDTPKSESPKSEPVKTEPPKAEPPKTDPAKTTPPKTEPTKTEPSKTEPLKTDPTKTDPAKTPAPATTTPSTPSTYTPPTLTDAKTKIPVFEYDPVDNPKVQDTIRTEISRQKGSKAIDAQLKKLSAKVGNFESQLSTFRANGGSQPPSLPDFQAMAKDAGVTFHTTDWVSQEEISQTELGKSYFFDMRQGLIPFVAIAFDPNLRAFSPKTTSSADDEATLLWWRMSDKDVATSNGLRDPYVPKFEDVRSKVLYACKMVKARDLAKKQAEEYADEANKAHRTLKDLFHDRANLTPAEIGPFSWLTPANIPQNPQERIRFSVTRLSGVDDAGSEFMRTVFDMETGKTGVALNEPKTVAYVIQLEKTDPSDTVLQGMFASRMSLPSPDWSDQAAAVGGAITLSNYYRSLEEEFDYKQVATLKSARPNASSMPMPMPSDDSGDE